MVQKIGLVNGVKPATVNRETVLLAQAFRLAIKRRQISMAPDIRKLPEKNVRKGFFERHEFEAVAETLPDYLRGFAWFGYLCGWRKGEIASLTWPDVDMIGRVVRLCPEHSKNGEGRVLPLEGGLWNVIQRQWAMRGYEKADGTIGTSEYIFHRRGERVANFRKAWTSACKAAKVEGKLFHDLRRTFARDAIRGGCPESKVMEITGHKTRAMLYRYSITVERDLREALQRTESFRKSLPAEATPVAFPETKRKTSVV